MRASIVNHGDGDLNVAAGSIRTNVHVAVAVNVHVADHDHFSAEDEPCAA